MVVAPGNGKVTDVENYAVTIKLTQKGVEGFKIVIKGFKPNISEGAVVSKNAKIGETTENDKIVVKLFDKDGKELRVADYMKLSNGRVNATDDDVDIMIRTVYGEAGVLTYQDMVAVAQTIINRARINHLSYGTTLAAQATAPSQYDGWGRIGYKITSDYVRANKPEVVNAVNDALNGEDVFDGLIDSESVVYFLNPDTVFGDTMGMGAQEIYSEMQKYQSVGMLRMFDNNSITLYHAYSSIFWGDGNTIYGWREYYNRMPK